MAHNILSRAQTVNSAGSDLIHRREVQFMTSLSPSAIYRLIHRGLFPRPIRISPMRVAWLRGEVRGWIEQRIAEQRAEEVDQDEPALGTQPPAGVE